MDVASMAERMSSAVSAMPTSTPAEPAVSTPTPSTPEPTPATPEPATTPAAAPVATGPELTFEDDEPELTFEDEEAAPPPPAAAPAAPAEDKEAAELSALLKANGLPKQVEDAFMRTNRGRNLLAIYKSERVLKESPNFDPATGENKGGLGFMPTPEQIKDYHRAHSDWSAMTQEFVTNPASFALNWFGPDATGNFREGVDKVLASVPQVLDQAYAHAERTGNQQLREQAVGMYRTVFAPMLQTYLDGFYQRATALQDPAQREQFINAARAIESDMFGKFREDSKLAPPSAADPLAEREQELAERERRLNAWQTKQQGEAQKAAENEIFSTIDQNLTKDCEKALASVKNGMSERAFRAAVNDFKREIQDAVRKNHVATREFNFKLSAARTARGADARTAPVQVYQQTARQAIQARYRTVLQELATGAERQNGALHATASAAAAQTAPAVNGGQAPPQSIVPGATITRKPGEDRAEYMQRRLAGALSPN
jgi:hypothetical protein